MWIVYTSICWFYTLYKIFSTSASIILDAALGKANVLIIERIFTVGLFNTKGLGLWDEGDNWEHRNEYEFHVACFELIKWLSSELI